MKDSTPYEAGTALLGQGIRFRISLAGKLKIPFVIRPLHPGTILFLSREVETMQEVNDQENMVAELLKRGENLRVHCRMVAMAILNGYLAIKLFTRPLAFFLQWKVKNNEELLAYVSLIYRQMDAERFFFIMTLTKGMNFLRKKPDTGATSGATPSGEPLP